MDLSPGIVTSPFKPFTGQIVLTFIYNIPEFLSNPTARIAGIFVVKFNTQNPFFKFSVVYNSNIF